MSESWFEGVGLAESPFADEVEAPVEAWPAETVRLPPSWPEEEEDGAGGELPLATEAWTPWAPAESLAEAAEAEEAEDGPGTGRLSASRLEWPSASADQLAFMRAVSDRHVAQVLADASANVPDAPAEPPTHRKVDRWDGAFELAPVDELEEADREDAPGEDEEAEDEDGVESGEVELGEAEAFFDRLDSLEPDFEEETGPTVTFPSGATLRVVSGPTGVGEEHYDPATTGNPLLDTSEPVRSKLLSASFSVGELSRSGGRNFDKARIDPELVRCLQRLRDRVGKPLRITSSYRPYAYNDKLYKETYKRKPTRSRHSSGQAADIRIAGMSGMEIAKAAIDALGTNIGVGIADTYAHVDVRGRWARWTYFGAGTEKDRLAIAEIGAYRRRRRRAGAPAPSLEQSPVDEGEEAPVEEGEEGPIGDGREPPWVGLADDELVEAPASDLAATDSPPPPLPDRLDRQVHELPEFKLAASPAASPMVFTLPERLSFLVQRLLDIKPTHRWNDKELERLIVTVSLPIDQALAYVGRMVGLDRRLAGLDLSFAHRAYDAAMERMVAGAEELHRYGIGIKTRHFAVVRTYFEGLKERRHRIEQALMALYSSDAALAASPTVNAPERGWGSSPPASLLQGTREINDEDRRRLTSILRPAPIPSIWGEPAATGKPDKPAKFQMRIPGVKEDFRTRVREHAELMIRELTKGYVTGKGAAERATVTPWARYQEIANAAKRSVDASFGAFAQRPAFVAGKNLKDRWEEVGKEQARFGAPERTGSAQGILSSMARSDSYLTRIKQQHHALPGRAPEQGILDTVLDDVAGRHIPELLAINRGWPGTQDSKTHSVNIQRWRVDNPGDAAHTAQRRDFWDVFQTIVHEYIHSLAEPRYEAFANKQPGDVTKILIEGVTSLLTEVAYSNVDPSNHLLRTQVEGQDLAGLPFDAKTVPDIRGQRYGQYNPALAMVGVVGLPNLYAAYFLGKTNLIKHAGAR